MKETGRNIIPLVHVLEGGAIVKKHFHAAALTLIRANGGDVDGFSRVSGIPKTFKNTVILDGAGKPIPFSEGVICQKKTGGTNCRFGQAGEIIKVLRIGDKVIIPGHIAPLPKEAVPKAGLAECSPDKGCPLSCVNNSMSYRRQDPAIFKTSLSKQ